MSTVTFDNEKLGEYKSKFQDFLNSYNNVYSGLNSTAEQLMSYGWKGSASQPFYNNLANYFEQMEKSKEAIASQLSTLETAAATATSTIEEVAKETI